MEKRIDVFPVQQPIGTFYMGVMDAQDLLRITAVNQRKNSVDGVQREVDPARIKEIASFTFDPDATFPTPVIISVNDNADAYVENNSVFVYESDMVIGEVLDGQHRLRGLENSSEIGKFQMPVILMFGLTDEENAYVFSIINSKQTKVNTSLIYDLYDLSTHRSPQKTAHDLARSMNSMEDSPFYLRLKMLGTKEVGQDDAILSQGTFAKTVMTLYSKNVEDDKRKIRRNEPLEDDGSLYLRKYFIKEQDKVILLVLENCFLGLKRAFLEHWKTPKDNILWKSTGFGAIIKALPALLEIGVSRKNLTEDFFYECFMKFRNKLEIDKKKLISSEYGSGEQAQRRLAGEIVNAVKDDDDGVLM